MLPYSRTAKQIADAFLERLELRRLQQVADEAQEQAQKVAEEAQQVADEARQQTMRIKLRRHNRC